MAKLEKLLLLTLLLVSMLMFQMILSSHMLLRVSIDLFPLDILITYTFYSFSLGVPIFMFIRWLINRNIYYFKMTLLASVPIVLFATWFIFTLIALGEVLSHF